MAAPANRVIEEHGSLLPLLRLLARIPGAPCPEFRAKDTRSPFGSFVRALAVLSDTGGKVLELDLLFAILK